MNKRHSSYKAYNYSDSEHTNQRAGRIDQQRYDSAQTEPHDHKHLQSKVVSNPAKLKNLRNDKRGNRKEGRDKLLLLRHLPVLLVLHILPQIRDR